MAEACIEEVLGLMGKDYPELANDRALIARFAESRDNNPKKTVEILEKYLKTAKKHKMGEIDATDPILAPLVATRPAVNLDPAKYADVDGNLVVYNSVAKAAENIARDGFPPLEHELCFIAYQMSERARYMTAQGIPKYTVLMDLCGAGKIPVKAARMRKVLELQQVLSRGLSSRFVIYPAGKKVTVTYKVLKPFLKKRVTDKVVMIKKEDQAELLKYFPKSTLPPHLGGTNTELELPASVNSGEDDEDVDEKAMEAEVDAE